LSRAPFIFEIISAAHNPACGPGAREPCAKSIGGQRIFPEFLPRFRRMRRAYRAPTGRPYNALGGLLEADLACPHDPTRKYLPHGFCARYPCTRAWHGMQLDTSYAYLAESEGGQGNCLGRICLAPHFHGVGTEGVRRRDRDFEFCEMGNDLPVEHFGLTLPVVYDNFIRGHRRLPAAWSAKGDCRPKIFPEPGLGMDPLSKEKQKNRVRRFKAPRGGPPCNVAPFSKE
jgi:hypothetical protein